MIRQILSFLPFVLIVAVSYFTKEFYPLSSFPMYSKFDERTYLTYLRGPDGKALGTVPAVGMYSSQLKKRYGAELNDLKEKYKGSHYDWSIEQKTEAGRATLEWLKTERETKLPENVELVDLRIFLKNGEIVREEQVVAKFNTAARP